MFNQFHEEGSPRRAQNQLRSRAVGSQSGKKKDLEADVAKHSPDLTQPPPDLQDGEISTLQSVLGALSNQIASLDSELTVESAVSSKSEAELVDLVDTLQRVTSIIQKETARKLHSYR